MIDVNKIADFLNDKDIYSLSEFTRKEILFVILYLGLEETVENEKLTAEIVLHCDISEDEIDDISDEEYEEAQELLERAININIEKLESKKYFLQLIIDSYDENDKINIDYLDVFREDFLSDEFKSIKEKFTEILLDNEDYEVLSYLKKLYENN